MRVKFSFLIYFALFLETIYSLQRSLLNSLNDNFTSVLEYSVKNITNLKDNGNLLQIPNSRMVIYVDFTTIFTADLTPTLIAVDLFQPIRVIAASKIESPSEFLGKIVLINNFYVATVTNIKNQNYLSVFFLDLNNEKFVKVASYPINTDFIYSKCSGNNLDAFLHFLQSRNQIMLSVFCPSNNLTNTYTVPLNVNNEFSFSQNPLNLIEVSYDFTSKLIIHPDSIVLPNLNSIVFPGKLTQIINAPLYSNSSSNYTIYNNTGFYFAIYNYELQVTNYCQLASFKVDSMFEDVQIHLDYGITENKAYVVWGTPSNNFYFSIVSFGFDTTIGPMNCKISERIPIREPLYSIKKIRFNSVLRVLVISDFFSFKSFLYDNLSSTISKCSEVTTSYHVTRDMLILPSKEIGYSLVIAGYNNLNNGLKVLNGNLSTCSGCDIILNGSCLLNASNPVGMFNFNNYYFNECPYINYQDTNSTTCELVCPYKKLFDLATRKCFDICPTGTFKLGLFCLNPLPPSNTNTNIYRLINGYLSLTCGVPSLPTGFVPCSNQNLTCLPFSFLNEKGDKCIITCASNLILNIENQKYCLSTVSDCPIGTNGIKVLNVNTCSGCGIGKLLNSTTNQCYVPLIQSYAVNNIGYNYKYDTCSAWVNRSLGTPITFFRTNFINCEENCPVGQYPDTNNICTSCDLGMVFNGTTCVQFCKGLVRNEATRTCIDRSLSINCNRNNSEFLYKGSCLNSKDLPFYDEEYVNYCPKLSINSGKICSDNCSGIIKGVSCYSTNFTSDYGVIINNQWALFDSYFNNTNTTNYSNNTDICSNYNLNNCSYPCPFNISSSRCGSDCPSQYISENNICFPNKTCPLGMSVLSGINYNNKNYTYCVKNCKYQTLNTLKNFTNYANVCVSYCEASYMIETNNQCVDKCPSSLPYKFINKTNSKVYCRSNCGFMFADSNNYCVNSCSSNQVFVKIYKGSCSSNISNSSFYGINSTLNQSNQTFIINNSSLNQIVNTNITTLNISNLTSFNVTNNTSSINSLLNSSNITITNDTSLNQTNITISKRIRNLQIEAISSNEQNLTSNISNLTVNDTNLTNTFISNSTTNSTQINDNSTLSNETNALSNNTTNSTNSTNNDTITPTNSTNSTNNDTITPTNSTNSTNNDTITPTNSTNSTNNDTITPTNSTNSTKNDTITPTNSTNSTKNDTITPRNSTNSTNNDTITPTNSTNSTKNDTITPTNSTNSTKNDTITPTNSTNSQNFTNTTQSNTTSSNSSQNISIISDCEEIRVCSDSCSSQTIDSSKYIDYNGECIDKCPPSAQFYDSSSLVNPCVKECKLGYANENMMCMNSSNCTSDYPFILKMNNTNICVSNCLGQILNSDAIYNFNNTCVTSCGSFIQKTDYFCVNSCSESAPYKIFEGSSKYCDTSCPDYLPYSDENKTCLATCDKGYYLENKCVKSCPKGFNVTMINGKNTCSNGCTKNLPYWNSTSLICVEKCGPKTFTYEFNKTCFDQCPSSLLIKSINNSCVDTCVGTADTPLYLMDEYCVSQCPSPNFKAPATDNIYNASFTCVSSCPEAAPFFSNNTCYEVCPKGFYGNSNNECVSFCPNFVVDNICNLTCTSGYFNLVGKNKICVEKCDNYTDIYKQCYNSCPSNIPFISDNTTCMSKCPLNNPYVYQDENGKNCVNSCPSNTFLVNGTCSAACPKYFSKDSSGTNVCIPTCNTKVRKLNISSTQNSSLIASNLQCTSSCSSNESEFINLCLSEGCPNILPEKNITQSLNNVNFTSRICSNPCISSSSPFFNVFPTFSNYDQTLPIDLQYIGAVLNRIKQTTSLSKFNCISSCPVYSYRNICLSECPYGWFVNTKTFECQDSCLGFKSNRSGVLFCSNSCDGLIGTDGISCLSSCPDGSFIDVTKKKCVASCDLYYNKQCVTGCPSGTFLESTSNKCYDKCPFGMAPSGTNCLPVCADGQFLNRDLRPPSCNPCNSACSLCTSSKVCTKCAANNFMISETSQCVKECPEGYYASPDKNLAVCIPCPSSCKSCVNSTLCNYCNPGFNLLNLNKIISCNSTCPDGTYVDSGICRNCTVNCLKCSSDGCGLCKSGMFLDSSNNCVSSCVKGIPLLDKSDLKFKCMPCAEGCESCVTSQSNCSTCISNYYLSNDTLLNTKSCVSSCKSGTYPDTQSKSCLPCYFSCKTCSGKEKNNCQTCLPSYPTFVEGECLSSCKGGQILQSNGKCTNFKDCFASFVLNSTSIHDISTEDFIIGIVYKTQSSCVGEDEYMKNFTFNWFSTVDGNISQDGRNFIINKNETMKGQFGFMVNISYNNFSLLSLQKTVIFNSFKILVKFKNENKLQFFNKYPLALDACLTLDESSTNPNDSKLKYTWTVPPEFLNSKKYLDLNSCSISIAPEDYAPALTNKNGNNSLDINLEVSKGLRKASKKITVTVDTTSPSSEQLMSINLGQISNKFIVFQFNYADATPRSNLFKFLWSIENFTSTQYLNGQTSSSLKISSEDLTQTSTNIKLAVTDSSMKTYNLNYTHTKLPPPSECKCLVTPFTGTFLDTEFTFTVSDCQTESKSLSYKYFYANKDGIMASFTQNIFLNTYVSKMVPLSLNNKYTVEITDIQGLSSVFVCPLAVTKKLEDKGLSSSDISNLVGNVTDPQEKINVNLD